MDESSEGPDHVVILAADPNPDDTDLLRQAFDDANIANDLHIVTNGDDALDFLHQRDDHTDSPRPHLILLDLDLEGTSAEDLLTELDTQPELRRIPVIVMTNSDAKDDIIQSYDLNANAYLKKPVEPDPFIDTVRSIKHFWLRIVRLPPVEDDEDTPY